MRIVNTTPHITYSIELSKDEAQTIYDQLASSSLCLTLFDALYQVGFRKNGRSV